MIVNKGKKETGEAIKVLASSKNITIIEATSIFNKLSQKKQRKLINDIIKK